MLLCENFCSSTAFICGQMTKKVILIKLYFKNATTCIIYADVRQRRVKGTSKVKLLARRAIKASHALISILHTKFTRAKLEKTRYQSKHSLGAVQGINVQQLLQNVLKTVFIASVFRWFLIKKYKKETTLQ